ncbi:Cys-tRNA(Pro) deacylase [Falsibacillus albus]|uniref:Cys-tRNA(Pro)/Cys-tRNA(Cys) deacylase n=1 Tax=Falsibacillus albus TaxID=2478915 RepID=A0A3L7JXA5_9BACI|nr:Cys-tRNA(Pro) deacylase [Falsibacillus albus]RLQ93072.1 Cys-tRNA(Pro) deacylase [Falsibacillus albus]
MKTNAVRILDAKKVDYELITYEIGDGKIDGISVAEKIGRSPESVYKTLVTAGASRQNYVFLVPVHEELDPKKAAKAVGEKKVELIPVKEIQKLTGYVKGGCSPVGMKKAFPTFLDSGVKGLQKVVVSAGKIGLQMELNPEDLMEAIGAKVEDLKK